MKKGITAFAVTAATVAAVTAPGAASAAPTAESALVCGHIDVPNPHGGNLEIHPRDFECPLQVELAKSAVSNCPHLMPPLGAIGLAGTCQVSANGYKGTFTVAPRTVSDSGYTVSAKKVKKKKGKKKKVTRLNAEGFLVATATA